MGEEREEKKEVLSLLPRSHPQHSLVHALMQALPGRAPRTRAPRHKARTKACPSLPSPTPSCLSDSTPLHVDCSLPYRDKGANEKKTHTQHEEKAREGNLGSLEGSIVQSGM